MTVAPIEAGQPRFTGRIAGLLWHPGAQDAAALRAEARRPPDPSLIAFTSNSPHWPTQRKQQLGQENPQPPETLPVGRAPASRPVAKPLPIGPALVASGPDRWRIDRWQLAAAPDVAGDGASLSTRPVIGGRWHPATVPGTVLTTLVDRGVYPDPAHGLDNLVIPEKLAHQDYWYRTTFTAPLRRPDRRLYLRFDGINYAGEIWVNGHHIGTTRGAFVRGRFDVGNLVAPGAPMTVAVRVSPPPHPGIAQEESMTAGAGENGGMLVLDGPTFVASEGWDWIPSIRDRNTGLWQGVELEESGAVTLGDVQVATVLPRPDNSIADLTVSVPVINVTDQAVTTTVAAAFDDVHLARTVPLAPHERRVVRFDPASDPALHVRQPRLWWPNGYGEPALHPLAITATVNGETSDRLATRFGIREVSYETSLVDARGALRRVLVEPARDVGRAVVDTRHEALRKVTGGWAASIAAGAEPSPALVHLDDTASLSPFLVLRVNGVRIAARGGNWGMDDLMKRSNRARLEPFFRLHREANINIVRNWVGQNTEQTFYDLADEYGMMVLNDFWESTQNYNQQADDEKLFLRNATDVVHRYGNHPSIVAWIGRNEGVPQPALNEMLAKLVTSDDGTRLYLPSSNTINLAGSGPYDWREPEGYFEKYGRGFAIEMGTPSFPTLETWQRAIEPADRWPIGDAWAYHDWHQDKGGSVKSYMAAMVARYGAPTDLTDFGEKAQLLQYDAYRAIFEGMNAGLWKTTSGRMLWMSQPAWPSSAWNIYAADYDTPAGYFAVKAASEPVHVQMNLPDHSMLLVNNRRTPLAGVTVTASTYAPDGRLLQTGRITASAAAGATVPVSPLSPTALHPDPLMLVRLGASDPSGAVLSSNSYWVGGTPGDLKALTALPRMPVALAGTVDARDAGGERVVTLTLANTGAVPVVQAKLTLLDARGRQMLPAYWDDNYITLVPGEHRTVTVRLGSSVTGDPATVTVRGINTVSATAPIRKEAP
jgi:hypothetical protein